MEGKFIRVFDYQYDIEDPDYFYLRKDLIKMIFTFDEEKGILGLITGIEDVETVYIKMDEQDLLKILSEQE